MKYLALSLVMALLSSAVVTNVYAGQAGVQDNRRLEK